MISWGKHCISQEKYDGSNIRCEWFKKKGWYQFALCGGGMIEARDSVFGSAIELFTKEYGEPLIKAIYDYKPFAAYRDRISWLSVSFMDLTPLPVYMTMVGSGTMIVCRLTKQINPNR